jgi:membrane protein DedA with SNARE-associated domain
MLRLLVEMFMVGLMTVAVGSLVGYIIGKMVSSDLPSKCKEWNKFYVMEISLFITGALIHLVCEVTGINGWYCRNGVACKSSR